MADATEAKIDAAKAEAAAEKAYAAAAEKVEAKPVVEAKAEPAPAPAAQPAAPKAAVAKPAAAKPPVAKTAKVKPAAKKPALKKAAIKPAPKKIVKPAVTKAAKPAVKVPTLNTLKETVMTKTKTTAEDFTAKINDAVAEAQDRAKVAFEKSKALMGEAGEFTKGNVEAMVESTKILAAGLQDMGKDYVAEGKSAIETVQADIKDLAAVKTPADFFKLQGEIMRRNFDAAVASGSKHSEAVVKLANEAFAPLSTRVSLAIEKVKQAA
ncbi:phasin family protein [Novosphingobium kunmingense]|uniref:Phasin family protein n=1 Tax=Novosphingobium kunmingense TaxID=1211806 RepID=A0A2N0H750_9SPHN|nr:phasin family protein [Novosphingobium kunmingense]PKB14754.1 phasin family protein [Novosphingobium kunmingense]